MVPKSGYRFSDEVMRKRIKERSMKDDLEAALRRRRAAPGGGLRACPPPPYSASRSASLASVRASRPISIWCGSRRPKTPTMCSISIWGYGHDDDPGAADRKSGVEGKRGD